MNKKNEDSYFYVLDNNYEADSSALHTLYILFLLIVNGQVEVARLIPCIKKDPKLI
tara:strand:+ start:472 stop:639 length:168 start_codon:yes stop_codon:yes gene_type:complete